MNEDWCYELDMTDEKKYPKAESINGQFDMSALYNGFNDRYDYMRFAGIPPQSYELLCMGKRHLPFGNIVARANKSVKRKQEIEHLNKSLISTEDKN